MDVYLVPLAADRFALYYEAPDDSAATADAPSGMFGRLRERFAQTLRDAERARHQVAPAAATSILGRLQQNALRLVAERVAEQRLLWHLGRESAAVLHIPADLETGRADALLRDSLKQDADGHRWRLLMHSVGLAVSAPLVFFPGPNLFGYFFTFTVVSHFLAWRGARRGLTGVAWQVRPSVELADLRGAFALHGEARHELVHAVAARLRLHRLATFVERMTRSTA